MALLGSLKSEIMDLIESQYFESAARESLTSAFEFSIRHSLLPKLYSCKPTLKLMEIITQLYNRTSTQPDTDSPNANHIISTLSKSLLPEEEQLDGHML